MRTLAGDLAPLQARSFAGNTAASATSRNISSNLLRDDASALAHIRLRAPKATEQTAARLSRRLGIRRRHGDCVRARSLSGGEKARLVLALIAWGQPAVLLLDEPTNHLDIEMRHALTVALQDYEGAMVIVSHDRDLLGRCVDEFWLVSGGRVEPYDDDLEHYAERIRQRVAPVATERGAQPTRAPPGGRGASASDAGHCATSIKRLEARIESTSNAVKVLDANRWPIRPRTKRCRPRICRSLIAQRTDLVRELSAAEGDWLQQARAARRG